MGAPPPDPRAFGRLSFPKHPPPIADFWLRAGYMLFVYVAVELNS